MDYEVVATEAMAALPEYLEGLAEFNNEYELVPTGLNVYNQDKDTRLHISYVEAVRYTKTTHDFTPAYTREELLEVTLNNLAQEVNAWYIGTNDISLGQETQIIS